MKITETKVELRKAIEIVKNEVLYAELVINRRTLLPEEELHARQDLALELGSKVATLEGLYAEFARPFPRSKKFLAIR